MAKYKAVVTDHDFPHFANEKSVLEPLGFEVVDGACQSAEEAALMCEEADAVFTNLAPIDASVIVRMRKCRIIVRYGVGVDNVDIEAARLRNIPVVNVPDYAINEVADHAFALLLAVVRKIPQVNAYVRTGRWEIAPCQPIIGLQDKVLGLAGFGHIAKAVAKRGNAFGFRVIGYDPYVNDEMFESNQTSKVDWETLLQKSDIVSVHLPLNDRTFHLFNDEAFRLMKRGAYIVNTSRGGVIDSEHLVDALAVGKIAGAGLDVLEQEPAPLAHRLLQFEQCIVTSHCAWYSEDSLRKLQLFAALEVKRLFTGEKPKNIVNNVNI